MLKLHYQMLTQEQLEIIGISDAPTCKYFC